MYPVRPVLLIPVCLALAGLPAARGQDVKEDVLVRPADDRRDWTLLKRLTERSFLHEPTGVAYTIPPGWNEIRPHRLERKIDKRINTVLGIESPERDLVASLYWIQMPERRKLADFVRDTPDAAGGEYGEEYETLKAVYGKDRVTRPLKAKYGPFEVYRIYISGGPERGEKYDGALFVFEVENDAKRWLVKARVSFPKGERATTDPIAMEVLQGYSLMPVKSPAGEPRRITTLDEIPAGSTDTDKK